MNKSLIVGGLAIALLAAVSALSLTTSQLAVGEEATGMKMAVKGDQGASSMAFAHVNMMMMGGMEITYTGDADIDFLKGMIPHHQGAIDMAKVVLKFGKDAEVKKLAEAIIAAQEGEIAQMQTWLKARGQ